MDILSYIGQCSHDIVTSYGLYGSLLLAGLFGSVTHCVAMCGPFVLSQSEGVVKMREASLLFYHLGRLTTYTVLAVILASVLNIAFLFLPIKGLIVAPLLLLAAAVFFVNAFPSLGRVFPSLGMGVSFLPAKWRDILSLKLMHEASLIKQYLLGVLLGFMPCGLVLSALMISVTAPSVFESGLSMLVFGVGTVPALVVTAIAGSSLYKKYPKQAHYVRQGMMIWSGVWLLALAGFNLK